MLCDSNGKDEPGNVAISVDETVGVNIALIEQFDHCPELPRSRSARLNCSGQLKSKEQLASETEWGPGVDDRRVEIMRHTIAELHKRGIGLNVYTVQHSAVHDLHCRGYGRSGGPGFRYFVSPDGSLRVSVQPWWDGPFLTHGRFANRSYALGCDGFGVVPDAWTGEPLLRAGVRWFWCGTRRVDRGTAPTRWGAIQLNRHMDPTNSEQIPLVRGPEAFDVFC